MSVINWIVNLGPSVVVPVLIFILALILGEKPGRAFRSGLTVGIGFIGINLVIGLLVNNLGPAAQDMVHRIGIHLDIIDVGWPATSAIAFGSHVGSLAIPIGLVVNILMLVFGLTKTFDIDLWNYWHIAFTGALVSILTNSFLNGVITAGVHMIILLVIADKSAIWVEKYYGYPNITFPHGTSIPYYLIGLPLKWLFDRIPGVRSWKADSETLQKKLGLLGDSNILALILGIIIGILAGYDVTKTLQLGVSLAAVMMLLPRTVSILMEGLIPVSEVAGEFVRKRFPGRDFYIGMDSAIAVGDQANISSSLILVPITLILAVILPGNRVLPFGDLATIPFIVALLVPIFRGNVIQTVLAGAISIGIGLYIATWVSPLFTIAAKQSGFKFPDGASSISSLVDGANPMTLILLLLAKIGIIGIVLLGIFTLVIAWLSKRKQQKTNGLNGSIPS
ncbi:PTS galactitol transporter subunit IIC [Fodinisporobacter ferrooxydans]|uniref:PTS galactitol transporter subunit IIC n=1 Tax=Fodinisporobacter ferrooxydans TaxID=2901836 RepID=A0ABY4CIR5_9BACL|nr:PTS galactitol transporter subunit IIC [Alicyclobacillaceae bacterium MYW30-H2]